MQAVCIRVALFPDKNVFGTTVHFLLLRVSLITLKEHRRVRCKNVLMKNTNLCQLKWWIKTGASGITAWESAIMADHVLTTLPFPVWTQRVRCMQSSTSKKSERYFTANLCWGKTLPPPTPTHPPCMTTYIRLQSIVDSRSPSHECRVFGQLPSHVWFVGVTIGCHQDFDNVAIVKGAKV